MATMTHTAPAYGTTATLNPTQSLAALIGRVLLVLLYIPSGWGKLVGFAGTVAYIQSKGVPLPEVCAAIAVAAELGLGLLILVGYQARWAALGLAIFTLVITPIFHGYWAVPEAQVMMQKLNFWKNLSIVGGLLMLFAAGGGAYSVDGRSTRR